VGMKKEGRRGKNNMRGERGGEGRGYNISTVSTLWNMDMKRRVSESSFRCTMKGEELMLEMRF
jgi:hypothetical protein